MKSSLISPSVIVLGLCITLWAREERLWFSEEGIFRPPIPHSYFPSLKSAFHTVPSIFSFYARAPGTVACLKITESAYYSCRLLDVLLDSVHTMLGEALLRRAILSFLCSQS